MGPEPVRLESRDSVALIVMDDGKVNAMSRSFLRDLEAVIEKASTGGAPVVIAGSAKAFSAGLDLREVVGLDRNGWRDLFGRFHDILRDVLRTDAPTVAAITGSAIAGGAVLAMACDYRVASPTAPIGVPELRVGVPFPPFVIDLLAARLSPHAMRQTVLDAERVQGQTALATGWVDELAADPVAAAIAAAKRLEARNRAAYAALKARLNGRLLAGRIPDEFERYLDLLTAPQTKDAIAKGAAATLRKG